MIEALKQSQDKLDTYNARSPYRKPVELVRVSWLHPTAHVAWGGDMYTVCGVLLDRRHTASAEEGTRLCTRCARWIERRL